MKVPSKALRRAVLPVASPDQLPVREGLRHTADLFRSVRRSLGYTQAEVAAALGVSRKTLHAYERAKRDPPWSIVWRLRNIAANVHGRNWFDYYMFEENLRFRRTGRLKGRAR